MDRRYEKYKSAKTFSGTEIFVGYNDMWISERDIADDIIISFQDNVEQVQGWEISSELNGNNEKRLIKVSTNHIHINSKTDNMLSGGTLTY